MDFDNIGDFLYLILLAVFSIFGFIGKKKKGAENTKGSSKPFFETILSMGQDEEERIEPEPEPFDTFSEKNKVEETYETLSKSSIKPSGYIKKLVSDDGIKQTAKKTILPDAIKESEIGSEAEGVLPNFDNSLEIKRGIIFSELIKPKYQEM